MKCPVSMLPSGGNSPIAILFVIGAIAAITYAMAAQNNQAKTSATQPQK